MTSWKTTLTGVGSLFAGLGAAIKILASGVYDPQDIATAFAAISAGIGLMFARDNNKSSQDVGIRKGDK